MFSPSFLLLACREGIWQEDLAAWQLEGKQKEQLSVQNGAASVAGGHPALLAPASKPALGFVLDLRRKGSYSSDSHQPSCVPLEMAVLSSLMVFREVFASARRSGLVSWCWDGFGVVCGDAEQRVSKAWYPAAGWLLSPALP